MNERDSWTVSAMEKFGGSFVQALAACIRRADAENFLRLKVAFPEYWVRYEEDGRTLEINATED